MKLELGSPIYRSRLVLFAFVQSDLGLHFRFGTSPMRLSFVFPSATTSPVDYLLLPTRNFEIEVV